MKRRPPIDRTDPELARRFVDRDEADRLSAVSRRKVVLWCDGTVQGLPAHERVEYEQEVHGLTVGRNGCPACPRRGGTPCTPIGQTHPELARRLVDPADADRLSAGSQRRAALWCDGTVQGRPAHERVEYRQNLRNFVAGHDGCPTCWPNGRMDAPIRRTHPELARRVVNPDDADRLSAGTNRKVALWCDGTVQGQPAHERVEYEQAVRNLTRGRNGCPACPHRGGVPYRRTRPELARRFVDPADADRLSAGTNRKVALWCDGTVQGQPAHERAEYEQAVSNLTRGYNGCPACPHRGGVPTTPIRRTRPELARRFVNPDDADRLGAVSRRKVALWCDGTVQGKPAHERVEYEQAVRNLTRGYNGCPECRHRSGTAS